MTNYPRYIRNRQAPLREYRGRKASKITLPKECTSRKGGLLRGRRQPTANLRFGSSYKLSLLSRKGMTFGAPRGSVKRMRPFKEGSLEALRERLRTNFWLVPSVMGAVSVALALLLTKAELPNPFQYELGVEGARDLLSTAASSLVTVMGVIFSVLIVVLALASSQYGPRILRSHLRDPIEHFTIGIFVSTFIYCILVLQTLRNDTPVPVIALLVGITFAIASIALFLYFIHHIAKTIQAPNIIALVSADVIKTAAQLFPGDRGAKPNNEDEVMLAWKVNSREPAILRAKKAGYVQTVDAHFLLRWATKHQQVIEVTSLPGDFVLGGEAMLNVWPAESVQEADISKLTSAVSLGHERTLVQDVRFGLHQLVEVALHALSPGINEPFTAVNCIDRLGQALAYIASQENPSNCVYDSEKQLRVILPALEFPRLVRDSFEQVILFSAKQPYVLRSILHTLSGLQLQRKNDKLAVADEIERVKTFALRNVEDAAALFEITRMCESEIVRLRGVKE